jgi:hypothetical protein
MAIFNSYVNYQRVKIIGNMMAINGIWMPPKSQKIEKLHSPLDKKNHPTPQVPPQWRSREQ